MVRALRKLWVQKVSCYQPTSILEATSLVIGASRVEQLENNVAALDAPDLTAEELAEIDRILG